jgi:hypothetical protein
MSRIAKTNENLKNCICAKCPSFVNAAKQNPSMNNKTTDMHEEMYCAFGKSRSIEERKGCVCFNCRNFKRFNLTDGYFCMHSDI